MATQTFDAEYPGLNSLSESEQYGDMTVEDVPVNAIFQVYHLMVAVSGVLALLLILVLVAMKTGKWSQWRWLQKLMALSPVFPFAAIEAGWFTAELGRQPWVVYPAASSPDGVSLLTADAVSTSVSAPELLLTIVLFVAIYLLLFVAWLRIVGKLVKEGPESAAENAGVLPSVIDKIVGAGSDELTFDAVVEGGDVR